LLRGNQLLRDNIHPFQQFEGQPSMSITIRRRRGLKVGHTVSFGNAELVVDAAVADGGEGAGPTPHDLYDSALGACQALTVMWYAARKNIPVEDVAIRVERDATQERAGSYVLTTAIEIGGPLSDAQLAQLHAVAKRCPIHKLMTSVTTTIHTQLTRMS
jgi:putative redox protein